MSRKIIGIIGTRRRDEKSDYQLVSEAFWKIYEEGDIICSGGCGAGGDKFAKWIHEGFAIPYLEFPAQWEKYGKSAGFKRNTDIAKFSTVLIACVSPERTGGTEDTIKKFKKFNPNGEVILV